MMSEGGGARAWEVLPNLINVLVTGLTLTLFLITTPLPHPQVRVDSLIASECLYCGDMMIQSIDKPFIPRHKFESSLESWK